jgi:hypothetical protein
MAKNSKGKFDGHAENSKLERAGEVHGLLISIITWFHHSSSALL